MPSLFEAVHSMIMPTEDSPSWDKNNVVDENDGEDSSKAEVEQGKGDEAK